MTQLYIDGSTGEGGGQVVRTSLALAAVTGTPIVIGNIRAGRSRPGLRPQHVAGARALAQLSGGCLEGDRIGSERLEFRPSLLGDSSGAESRGPGGPGPGSFEIGTAGSIPLFLQTVLIFGVAYWLAKKFGLTYRDAAPSAMIGASNHFEVAIATAVMLFGLSSGAALATVVGVLIEVPVMLMLVKFCLGTRRWFGPEES